MKSSNPTASTPAVSVIVPAYGTSHFIAETLDSVFNQTLQDFETIVVNDGSPDTTELERVLGPYRDRIHYIHQANCGLAAARNTAIRHARGIYLAFLDSDDCWLPEYLETQIKILQASPSLDAVYCDAVYFGNPRLQGKTYMRICPSKGPVTLESLIRVQTQPIVSCTVARREVVLNAGLFDEKLRAAEDYDLWLRIIHQGGAIAYHTKILGRYRSRPDSLSTDVVRMSQTLLSIYEKVERTMEITDDLRRTLRSEVARTQARLDLELGKQLLAVGEYGRAKDSLTRAYDFSHSLKLRLAIIGLGIAPRLTRWCVMVWLKL